MLRKILLVSLLTLSLATTPFLTSCEEEMNDDAGDGYWYGVAIGLLLVGTILYNEYQFMAAFAVASLLALLALVTLVAKMLLERGATSE